jgi:hypothetical protein
LKKRILTGVARGLQLRDELVKGQILVCVRLGDDLAYAQDQIAERAQAGEGDSQHHAVDEAAED